MNIRQKILELRQLGYYSPLQHSTGNQCMTSNHRDQKHLRAIGHKLKPIITVAQKGLSENILAEIDRALTAHELIKVKLVSADRDERNALAERICKDFQATCVQHVGHIILLYRATREPDPRLSNILRNKIV